jgi:hypothetical protein
MIPELVLPNAVSTKKRASYASIKVLSLPGAWSLRTSIGHQQKEAGRRNGSHKIRARVPEQFVKPQGLPAAGADDRVAA